MQIIKEGRILGSKRTEGLTESEGFGTLSWQLTRSRTTLHFLSPRAWRGPVTFLSEPENTQKATFYLRSALGLSKDTHIYLPSSTAQNPLIYEGQVEPDSSTNGETEAQKVVRFIQSPNVRWPRSLDWTCHLVILSSSLCLVDLTPAQVTHTAGTQPWEPSSSLWDAAHWYASLMGSG